MTRLMIASLIVGALAAPGAAQNKEFSFPHVRANGRATPEFYYKGLQVVANYDYSQRNHKGAWLLIDMAAASRQRFVLHKRDVKLVTVNGRQIDVAPQQTVIDDSPRITELLQNARIWRRDLRTYFNQRTVLEPIRFQIAPPGSGTTSDESVVDNDRVAAGAILFKTPEGSWEAGTHRLEVNTEAGTAALPIKLE
jgi:hypothetical protein